MDGVLSKLLSFPPHPPPPIPLSDSQYDEGIKEQIEVIKKLSNPILLQKTAGGEDTLDQVINPAINTVPYTFILLASISVCSDGNETNTTKIWDKITAYLSLFDLRQIRYLGSEFTAIIDAAASFAQSTNRPGLALVPIRDALLRLDPSGAVLTSNHLRLARLALESRDYDALGPFLDNIVLYVPDCIKIQKPKHLCAMNLNPVTYITSSSGLTATMNYIDVLEYFICCGIACLGIRKWKNALKHFECAITYPTRDTVSKPMVEAYKKWLLTGLITYGKAQTMPKSTSSEVARVYHSLARQYDSLASVFENGSASDLKKEAEQNEKKWITDSNSALVTEVLASYQKFQIRNLAKIYHKISIVEIHNQTTSAEIDGNQLSVSDTERLVLKMINDEELYATLSASPPSPSILTFWPAGPILTESQIQKELSVTKSRIQYLSQEIKMTDRNLKHDRDYIKHLQTQKKASQQGNSDNENQEVETVMSWNDIVEDEDIMGVY
ncbi:COP9 signalosome complex subunit 3 [Golovinomyces cichoracearum]|uniref:COP9 signalosome complex subunit 3 n=1 Tax=Golovinomyces cichoracearum TaxID=62708 RepID=A0A420HHN9_9PEZI|nr:COP9 signalosome complex subunit 3 [Golovinomyces cichoracearum]